MIVGTVGRFREVCLCSGRRVLRECVVMLMYDRTERWRRCRNRLEALHHCRFVGRCRWLNTVQLHGEW